MFTTTNNSTIRELDRRTGDGIDVRLLWNPRTGEVAVSLRDERRGDAFAVAVRGCDALDAFRHPFAYGSEAGTTVAIAPAPEPLR